MQNVGWLRPRHEAPQPLFLDKLPTSYRHDLEISQLEEHCFFSYTARDLN